jgi:hypothetical protein
VLRVDPASQLLPVAVGVQLEEEKLHHEGSARVCGKACGLQVKGDLRNGGAASAC